MSEEKRQRRSPEDTSDVIDAVAGEIRLEGVLETIAQRARSMVNARLAMILLEDREALVVGSTAGEFPAEAVGTRLVADSSAWRRVMADRLPERVVEMPARLASSLAELGISADTALLVPLSFGTRSFGVLAAFDRIGSEPRFDVEDEQMLANFAASSAMTIATARSMAETRLRESIEVAERERARWARELHDETLQGLGALRVRLAASLRLSEADRIHDEVRAAIAQIEDEIASLRSLITELRPAALDELGLGAAIASLADSHAAMGLEVHLDLALAREDGVTEGRLDRELEADVYRVVQEALTNVAKHARAENVWVEVAENEAAILVRVRDDGVGFDMDVRPHGFGMVGMRERVALQGGSLTIVSTPGVGTDLRGRIPLD